MYQIINWKVAVNTAIWQACWWPPPTSLPHVESQLSCLLHSIIWIQHGGGGGGSQGCTGGWLIFVDLDFQTCCEFPAAVMECESSIFQFWVQYFIYRISHTPQASPPHLFLPTWTSIQSQRGDPQAVQWPWLPPPPSPMLYSYDAM